MHDKPWVSIPIIANCTVCAGSRITPNSKYGVQEHAKTLRSLRHSRQWCWRRVATPSEDYTIPARCGVIRRRVPGDRTESEGANMPLSAEKMTQLVAAIYEEAPSHLRPRIDCWVRLATGMMPLRTWGNLCLVPAEVLWEHGRYYIRHIQDHYQHNGDAQYIESRVALVGGSMPW